MLFACSDVAGQTFTFECKCEHVSDTLCDICDDAILSRSFHGLLVRRNGTPYRWLDEPYTIRQMNGGVVQFIEQIPSPDRINIALFQTQFATIADFLDSTTCFCGLGGSMSAVEVDTPLIGDGTPGNPLTIGQFGADTTKFLKWNGSHWYPGSVKFSDILNNLPYYKSDTSAVSGGLNFGDAYLLECANDYNLPAGILKVVKSCICIRLEYFINDSTALANSVAAGREYILSDGNAFGILYGFSKVVQNEPGTADYTCSTTLSYYENDVDAVADGLAYGDLYNMSAGNTYGVPAGINRAASETTTEIADAAVCCDETRQLPYFKNDTEAIGGGYGTGKYYYLSSANTYGLTAGLKKQVQ